MYSVFAIGYFFCFLCFPFPFPSNFLPSALVSFGSESRQAVVDLANIREPVLLQSITPQWQWKKVKSIVEDKAWRDIIIEKVKDGAPQAEVYKMLRTVLEERSEAKLSDLLGRALHILQSDAQKAAFQEYWESKWVSKVKERAFSQRLPFGINTNMYMQVEGQYIVWFNRKKNNII